MLGKINIAEHTINTDIFKAAIAASAQQHSQQQYKYKYTSIVNEIFA